MIELYLNAINQTVINSLDTFLVPFIKPFKHENGHLRYNFKKNFVKLRIIRVIYHSKAEEIR